MSKRLRHTKVDRPVMKLTQAELDKITEVGLRVPRGDLLPGSRLKRHDPATDTWVVMVYTAHPRPNDIESYTVEVVDTAVALYQELETAVRDLYYSDGNLERAWVDGRSACAWLSQEMAILRNQTQGGFQSERFSKETIRQIEALRERWGHPDVLWRCVERTFQQVFPHLLYPK